MLGLPDTWFILPRIPSSYSSFCGKLIRPLASGSLDHEVSLISLHLSPHPPGGLVMATMAEATTSSLPVEPPRAVIALFSQTTVQLQTTLIRSIWGRRC